MVSTTDGKGLNGYDLIVDENHIAKYFHLHQTIEQHWKNLYPKSTLIRGGIINMERQTDQDIILREKLIYRYVQAMDQGDVEEIAIVLEAALNDSELDRIITEIDLAYQEEELLTPKNFNS